MNTTCQILTNFILSAIFLALIKSIDSHLSSNYFSLTRNRQISILPVIAFTLTLCTGWFLAALPPRQTILCFALTYEIFIFTNTYNPIGLEALSEKNIHATLSLLLATMAVTLESEYLCSLLYTSFLLGRGQSTKSLSKILLGPKEERSKILKSAFSFTKDGLTAIIITIILGAIFLLWINSI